MKEAEALMKDFKNMVLEESELTSPTETKLFAPSGMKSSKNKVFQQKRTLKVAEFIKYRYRKVEANFI